jgi:hypothetical protein
MAKGVKIPITIGFDRHRCIGLAHVDLDLLPKDEHYVFMIGGTVNSRMKEKVFELTEISVLSDADAYKVLFSRQKPGGGK